MELDVEKIISKLENLGGGIAVKVGKAVNTGLKQIQSDAKLAAPVVTGQLRGSITTSVKTDLNGDIVGTVGTNLDYAAYVEFGTGPKGKASQKILPEGFTPDYRTTPWGYTDSDGKKWWTHGQPAKPFLYPAFKQNKADVKQRIIDAAKGALK